MASFATSSPRARVALLGLALASCAIFRSPTPQVKGRFLLPEVRPRVDDVLARPYTPDVPFAPTGDRLWATSPQGLAFDDGIHFLYVSNFVPFRVRVPGFRAGAATSSVSHVHVDAEAGNTVSASASFTYSADGADRPLAKPFDPSKRWTCWSSGRREDWYALELGGDAVVKGVTLFFFDDEAAKGACRAPERVRLERWSDGAWAPIANVESDHDEPAAGENRFTFAPVETDRLRFVFHHRGERFYTGLYGVVPVFEKPPVAPDVPPLKIAADKFLTADDVAVVVVTAKNEGFEPATLEVQTEIPWSNDKHTP